MAVAEVVLRESFDFELPDQKLCEGRGIVLNPSPRGNYLYQWSPADGLSCSDCPSPVCRISADAVYRCSIREEASGCRAVDSMKVKMFPSPRADFSVLPEPEISSLDFRFQNLSENSDAWFWQFGDGSVSTEFNPSHYYQSALNRDSAFYQVGLVAVNSEASCTDSLIKTLEIRNPMFIPNLVIRLGEQGNKSFSPKGILPGTWGLRLYDRYGTKFYENPAYQLDWNGSSASDGVYFYQLWHPATGRSFRGWLELAGQK
jgi:PKD repeat protein